MTSDGIAIDDLIDGMPLTRRYWLMFALSLVLSILDYFDFYVVGFLVAVLGPRWHLTFGQSAVILLSAGVGSIAGAIVWGDLSDRRGRRIAIALGTAVCGVSASMVALIPDGNWWGFAALRFFVGVGLAGAATPVMTLVVETTPRRWRTILTGLLVIAATAGVLVASLTMSSLLTLLGWRGVAALGIAPAFFGLFLANSTPESARWLASRGRIAEARAAHARMRGMTAAVVAIPMSSPTCAAVVPPWRDLLREPRRLYLTILLWFGTLTANYGVYLWGPTMVSLTLGYSGPQAAHVFTFVALAGIIGKLSFSALPLLIGRRQTNNVGCLGTSGVLAAIAFFHTSTIFGEPALVVLLVAGALFFDGVISNIAPYTVEIYPTGLAARGYGVGQAANGAGKIVGPLILALIAGSNNLVSPHATIAAATPAFLLLSACALVSALASILIPFDPLIQSQETEPALLAESQNLQLSRSPPQVIQ